MTIDLAREYTVIVNGGSGCFFQTADPDFTYILTAKHNIKDANNQVNELTHFHLRSGTWEPIEIQFGLEEGINYYPHSSRDIAILKIEKREGCDEIFKVDNLDENRLGYFLLGYPDTRRKASPNNKREWYREDPNVEILGTTTDQRRGALVPGNPDREEIVGHSGGAIVRIEHGRLLLGGIENRMAPTVDEQMGRIEFTPVHVFNEIIERHPEDLFPILSPHLTSFKFLQEDAFDLRAGWDQDDINNTINFLRSKCKDVIENKLTPIGVKELFKERLLIDSKNTHDLDCRAIWLLWLEFLTIINIAKSHKHSLDELMSLFNEYRLFFSNTSRDWSDEIENLVYSDYHGLKSGGLVIVGVRTMPELGTYIIDPNRIPMITQARKNQDFDKLKIDDGFGFPYDEYKFVHIEYFKKGLIVDKREEYRGLNDKKALLKKLKEVYGEAFAFQG